MTYDQATAVAADIGRAVLSPQPRTVREAFDALAFLDGYRIAQRARSILDGAVSDALADAGSDGADRLHRARMDVFYGSVFEYLEEKTADIEPSVEHDVPTWIEANALAVASANLKIMEAALPAHERDAHRTLIEFHGRIDFGACEAEQNRVLQAVWEDLDAAIRARLAAAGNGG
jgi:hypothetical protein